MDKGHGQKFSRRKEAEVAALLSERTIEEAARKVKISTRTMKLWIQDVEFMAEFRKAASRVLDTTVGRLQGVSEKAIDVLAKSLESKSEPTRLRCADSILAKTFKAAELLDLQGRVENIERQLKGEEQ